MMSNFYEPGSNRSSKNIVRVLLHVNQAIPHQVNEAIGMMEGFKKHSDIRASVTDQKRVLGADINIVFGPYYSLKEHQGIPNTLYIDRGYYEWPKYNSIHWVDSNTEKIWINNNQGHPRYHPNQQPKKNGRKAVVLLDHIAVSNQRDRRKLIDRARGEFDTVTIRYHPYEKEPDNSLEECLENHDVAFGHRTTALVEAALAGLEVRTKDIYSPVYPLSINHQNLTEWIHDLSWHMWTLEEMKSGEVWEYFSNYR